MGKKLGDSMFAPYEQTIIENLEAGKTLRQIFDHIISPALNGGCAYPSLVTYVKKAGLRQRTWNDGYERVPKCVECEHYGQIERAIEYQNPICYCRETEREMLPNMKTSPKWCPKRREG